MGDDRTDRVAAGLFLGALTILALTISPFLAAAVVGGAASALIEHAARR